MSLVSRDEQLLRRAIELSQQARSAGNQPFGSLLVDADGRILAQDVNSEITDNDITAHPELKLARWAGANLSEDEASKASMYTSCEACAMCSGAIVTSGLGRVVFALSAPQLLELKGGTAPGTLANLSDRSLSCEIGPKGMQSASCSSNTALSGA